MVASLSETREADTPSTPTRFRMSDRSTESGDSIDVAVVDGIGFARIYGRGSFKTSPSIKQFAGAILDAGATTLVIDTEACIGLDSTFMGVTAGLCGRFRKVGGGVQMVNASEKIQSLLSTLGLNCLVDVYAAGELPETLAPYFEQLDTRMESLPVEDQTPLESAKTMLEAHQTLVEVSESNRPRFKDVLDYLRDDIREHESS